MVSTKEGSVKGGISWTSFRKQAEDWGLGEVRTSFLAEEKTKVGGAQKINVDTGWATGCYSPGGCVEVGINERRARSGKSGPQGYFVIDIRGLTRPSEGYLRGKKNQGGGVW